MVAGIHGGKEYRQERAKETNNFGEKRIINNKYGGKQIMMAGGKLMGNIRWETNNLWQETLGGKLIIMAGNIRWETNNLW